MKHARSTHTARFTRHGRDRTIASLFSIILATLIGSSASPAIAGDAKPGAMIYDALIERPIGLVETTVGLAVATVAYPVGLATHKSDVVVDRCISEPARYTFTRPLGKFGKRPANLCSPVGLSWGLVGVSFSLVERPLSLLFGGSPLGADRHEAPDELEIDAAPPESEGPTELAI